MTDHVQRARDLFGQGFNCAQSVFAAFADETGMDTETSLKLAAPFGGGIARLREVCGAVTGMAMALGIKYGYTDPTDAQGRLTHYALVQSLVKAFEKKNGSLICRELLGLDKSGNPISPSGMQSAPHSPLCAGLVENAAAILEEYIKSQAVQV